jgi:hypothetical protein
MQYRDRYEKFVKKRTYRVEEVIGEGCFVATEMIGSVQRSNFELECLERCTLLMVPMAAVVSLGKQGLLKMKNTATIERNNMVVRNKEKVRNSEQEKAHIKAALTNLCSAHMGSKPSEKSADRLGRIYKYIMRRI